MLNNIADWLIILIQELGLWGVFFASIVEEMIAPIPSPLVMMSAGAALLGQYDGVSIDLAYNMTLIAIIGSVGATIGSYFPYSLAYFGGKPVLDRFGKYIGINWKTIQKLQEKLNNSKNDEVTLGFLRSIPVMPSVFIAATCGAIRFNFLSYTLSFFVGGIFRNFVFLIVGWQLGTAYLNGADAFESVSDWVTKILVVFIVIVLGYLYWRRSKIEKQLEE
jgi:membrane protein DedA with SNARE-associated domain